jgi:hypothetical protein
LFVRHTNGALYPAAIYLGGSGQTVVRAIDPDVVDLFLRAEVSGNGGGNNTSGGVTHTATSALGSPKQPGSITILIEPPEARDHPAAGWWLEGPTDTSAARDGNTRGGLSKGSYVLKMTEVPGFQGPLDEYVEVREGYAETYTYTYGTILTPVEEWRQLHFGITENTGDAADSADPDGDGVINFDEFTAGTDPNDPNDFLRVETTSLTGSSFTVTTVGKAGRVYELELSIDPASDPWTAVTSKGPLSADGEVTLTDANVPSDKAFYRVRVTKP